jgi:Zn-dependent protease with chaperone function
MGIFVFIVLLLLEVAGMAFSYWFGAHALHIAGTWATIITQLSVSLPGLRRYHFHVTEHTFGLFWLAGNIVLHIMAAIGSIRSTFKKRVKMGNPGMRELQIVERALRQLVTASPSGSLEPMQQFDWPLTFDYAPGHGMTIRFVGYRLVIDEGLLKSSSLKALLAHELGHWNSTDVALREMLSCLPPAFLVLGAIAGLPIGLGSCVTFFFWPWYWRQREYAADLFAARVGQAPDLIRALERFIHPTEKQKNLFFREYPYVAERIDRLMRLSGMTSTSSPISQQQRRRGSRP